MDADSDGGGCKDCEEDTNGNGFRDDPENSNFIPSDDRCGTLRGNIAYAISAINSDPNQIAREIHDQVVVVVRLKPEGAGSSHYIDDGSSFLYDGFARLEIDGGQGRIVS